MSGLTIGQLAVSAGVNVETIRFYERKGLLKQPEREGRRIRRYSADARRRLTFIRGARDLGFTLQEVGELLSLRQDPKATRSDVRVRTMAKLEDVDRRIEFLEEVRSSLKTLLQQCEGSGPASNCPILDSLESQ